MLNVNTQLFADTCTVEPLLKDTPELRTLSVVPFTYTRIQNDP